MRQLGQMKKSTKNSLFTYTLVIAAFVVVQALRMGPGVGAMRCCLWVPRDSF